MEYTVQKLATLAGVSVRTLHYYDSIGLLKPHAIKPNGYRVYGEKELLILQQILFFRELDFPLDQVKEIISHSGFNMQKALLDQKKLIELKKNRLTKLMVTIDKTLQRINKEKVMEDKELFGNFSKEEMEKYSQEAKERWGHTEAFKQSEERVKKMGKEGLQRALEENGKIVSEIAANMSTGPKSEVVQNLIAKHFDSLRAFYEPTIELYRGLANMYVDDKRFTATFEKVAPGLAQFMKEAMIAFCDAKK